MSSGTSTDTVPLNQDPARNSLQPWQFFVLAALACATVAIVLTRAQGISGVVLLSMLIGAAALVGLAGLRMLRPLVSAAEDQPATIGRWTREGLEREKALVLRTLKELEFDKAMGKMSDADFQEMGNRLRARAGRLIRQLDAGDGYRERIERDLAARLGDQGASGSSEPARSWTTVVRVCSMCTTQNEEDARFCKACGAKL